MPKQGRPTKYNEKILNKTKAWIENYEYEYDTPVTDKEGNEKMIQVANVPPFISDLAKYLRVNRDTIYTWIKKHKDFSDTISKDLKEKFKECLVKNALLGKYNPTFSIFAAKNCIGWKDKTEQEVEHNFPQKIKIEFVKPKE